MQVAQPQEDLVQLPILQQRQGQIGRHALALAAGSENCQYDTWAGLGIVGVQLQRLRLAAEERLTLFQFLAVRGVQPQNGHAEHRLCHQQHGLHAQKPHEEGLRSHEKGLAVAC